MKVKKKSFAAVLCVLLAMLTAFAMMPAMAYADTTTAASTDKSEADNSLNWYNINLDHDESKPAIQGDILIKEDGQDTRAYDTENQQGYEVKEDKSYTLGLTLNVQAIKTQMDNAINNGIPVQRTIQQLSSLLTAEIVIPDGLDVSEDALKQLHLGDSFGEYEASDKLKSVIVPSTSYASVGVDLM